MQENHAAITPESVSSSKSAGIISPDLTGAKLTAAQAAAIADLSAALTPTMVSDIVLSMPAGSFTTESFIALIQQIATDALTGVNPLGALESFIGAIAANTNGPTSTAAGKALVPLINGHVIRDIVVLCIPTFGHYEVRDAIALLKDDLKTGQGFGPWLRTLESEYGTSAAALVTHHA